MKERLIQVLKSKKLTQVELSERMGITQPALFNRLKNPTLKSISQIADAIGCDVAELISDSKKIQLIVDDELHTFYSLEELKKFTEEQ